VTTKQDTRDKNLQLTRRIGQNLYGRMWRGNSADMAEDELKGRTHYYEPSTRRWFNCRILCCHELLDGLILGTIESVKPPDDKRRYRCVFFDLLGEVIYRTGEHSHDIGGWLTSKSANREFSKIAESFCADTERARVLAVAKSRTNRALKQLETE